MPNVFGSLGTVWAEMGLDYRKLDEGVQGAISRLSRLDREAQRITMQIGQQFQKLGAAMSLAFTTPLTLMGRQIVETFAQFEQSLANAAAVSGATAEELRRMEQAAREAGATTIFSASEAADAMYYLASAGFTAEQQMAALKGILDLAAATQSDLAFAASTVTSTLSAFGLKASDTSRVANVFAAAIVSSQAELDKLADSMRYVGPVAGAFGLQLEEVTAALGLLYNAGLRGEQAGTTLRYALSQLANPAGQAAEVLKDLGLSADQVNPQLHSLADIIATLERAGIDGAQAMRLFGTEAGPGMIALLSQGSQVLREYTAQITGTNRASEVAEQQVNTLHGSLRLLHSVWEELSIALTRSVYPVLRQIVDVLSSVVSWFAELPGSVQRFIVVVGALTATLGPLVAAFGLFSSALSALAGPAGVAVAAVAAIGGLAAALMGLRDRANEALGPLDAVTRSLVSQVEQIRQRMRAGDEAARKLQDEINWLNRLLKPLEDVAGKQRLTRDEADALKSVLAELAQRFPWVDRAVTTTSETFRSQLTALQQYREHLRETLLDILEAKNIEAGLSLARLQATLETLEARRRQAMEEAQKLLQLQQIRDPFRIADLLKQWGIELKPGQNLFAVFAAEVERRSKQASESIAKLTDEITKTKVAIEELRQAQRDYAAFRATGRLPGEKSVAASAAPLPTQAPAKQSDKETADQVDADLQKLEAIMERHRQRLDVLRVTGQDIFGRGADLRRALAEYANILFEWANATSRSTAARAAAASEWESVSRELVAASEAEVQDLKGSTSAQVATLRDAIASWEDFIEATRIAGDDWRSMTRQFTERLADIVADERRSVEDRQAAWQALQRVARPLIDEMAAQAESLRASTEEQNRAFLRQQEAASQSFANQVELRRQQLEALRDDRQAFEAELRSFLAFLHAAATDEARTQEERALAQRVFDQYWREAVRKQAEAAEQLKRQREDQNRLLLEVVRTEQMRVDQERRALDQEMRAWQERLFNARGNTAEYRQVLRDYLSFLESVRDDEARSYEERLAADREFQAQWSALVDSLWQPIEERRRQVEAENRLALQMLQGQPSQDPEAAAQREIGGWQERLRAEQQGSQAYLAILRDFLARVQQMAEDASAPEAVRQLAMQAFRSAWQDFVRWQQQVADAARAATEAQNQVALAAIQAQNEAAEAARQAAERALQDRVEQYQFEARMGQWSTDQRLQQLRTLFAEAEAVYGAEAQRSKLWRQLKQEELDLERELATERAERAIVQVRASDDNLRAIETERTALIGLLRVYAAMGSAGSEAVERIRDALEENARKLLALQRQWAEETRRIWADVLRGFAGPLARPIEVVIRAWRETGAVERVREPWRAFTDQVRAFGRSLDTVLLGIPSRLARMLDGTFRWLGDSVRWALGGAGEWLQPALANLGASLANLFGPLGGVLSALAGPIGAFLAVLLEQAPQAQALMQALQQIVVQLATALGAILTPLVPVVQVLGQVLQPVIQALMPLMYMLGQALAYVGQIVITLLQPAFAVLAAILQLLTPIFQVLNPILYALAVIVTTIWNTIARVWNSAVRFAKSLPVIGWLFSWLPELQEVQMPQEPATTVQQAQQQAQEGARQGTSNAGTQVVNLTGESRNLFVELLRPIGNLDRLPGLFDNMLARLDRLVAIGEDIATGLGSTALAQAMQQFGAQVAALTQAVSAAIASVIQAATVQSGMAQVAQAIEVTGQATFQIQQASITIESASFYGNRISFSLLPDGRLIGRLLGRELQAALRGVGA